MGFINSFLKSPKKEEQQLVPDSTLTTEFDDIKESNYGHGEIDIMDELEGILGIDDENEEKFSTGNKIHGHLSWDFMDWEGCAGFHNMEEEDEEDDGGHGHHKVVYTSKCFEEDQEEEEEEEEGEFDNNKVVKKENLGFCWEDDDDKRVSLKLNLNYQEVLDAWSDRGPLWADDYSISMASNGYYMGEVPVMEEERARREASVLRYKEKRQTRLFSKKIRYQVRKLNADKRPRLKGRFVKRVS
ncbi:hypothetical protein CCACVL1_11687 [Corchorus capsularis]|uniref:CCT domain-containing protein n=2 Tax=Corchorus TaxID=93758 RepID=A0A1R3IJZ3_COCAP|nr:hypothetical protein CCACVL1_11687 [Corchorus capsularis]